MPIKGRCIVCGRPVPAGVGMMYVKSDGTILWFCSSKCYKSLVVLKRDPKKLAWVKERSEERAS